MIFIIFPIHFQLISITLYIFIYRYGIKSELAIDCLRDSRICLIYVFRQSTIDHIGNTIQLKKKEIQQHTPCCYEYNMNVCL